MKKELRFGELIDILQKEREAHPEFDHMVVSEIESDKFAKDPDGMYTDISIYLNGADEMRQTGKINIGRKTTSYLTRIFEENAQNGGSFVAET